MVNEAQIMKRIRHPNIVQMYDSFFDRQTDSQRLRKAAKMAPEAPSDELHLSINRSLNNSVDQQEAVAKFGMSLYISMEYAEEGDMQKQINSQKAKGKYFSEKELW